MCRRIPAPSVTTALNVLEDGACHAAVFRLAPTLDVLEEACTSHKTVFRTAPTLNVLEGGARLAAVLQIVPTLKAFEGGAHHAAVLRSAPTLSILEGGARLAAVLRTVPTLKVSECDRCHRAGSASALVRFAERGVSVSSEAAVHPVPAVPSPA